MKLDEIRERLHAGGSVDHVPLPRVPRSAFVHPVSGREGYAIGDVNNPGRMYAVVHQDVRRCGVAELKAWIRGAPDDDVATRSFYSSGFANKQN